MTSTAGGHENDGSPAIMTPMDRRPWRAKVFIAVLITACLAAACGNSPPRERGGSSSTKDTTTTQLQTSATSATSTTSTTPKPAGVAVPDVIGMKIMAARFYLRLAGFFPVPLTVPCNKGTMTSQSIVVSLSIPGGPPNWSVGAVPLVPGFTRPKGSYVGITWSGCYPGGAVVPMIAGLGFGAAVNLLHVAGLTWACYSSTTTTGPARSSTTTRPPSTTSSLSITTTTTRPAASTGGTPSVSHAVTSTTLKAPQTVLSQSPSAGTVLRPGAPVSVVLSACPQ